MDFVISSFATLKSSNEFDDIYCKQKKTIEMSDKMLNDKFQEDRR